MNHDYAHCFDYEENNARCPKSCFRAELTMDLLLNPQPRSLWMHFFGTSECPLKNYVALRGKYSDLRKGEPNENNNIFV